MKTRQFTRLIAIFAFAVFTLAACNKGATNSNNSNSNSNSSANKNATSPSPGGDYSSPTATMKSFYEASKANNIDGIKRSMSKKTMDFMTQESAKENKSVDQSLKEMIKDAPANSPETRNEKLDGDKATLDVKDEKMDKWDTIPFVKEDGLWKIAIFDSLAGAMNKMDSMDQDKK